MAVCPSEQQLKIAILVLSSVVLAGGAALLSAHRLSEPRVRAATEEPAAVDRGSGPSSLGPRPGAAASGACPRARPRRGGDRPAVQRLLCRALMVSRAVLRPPEMRRRLPRHFHSREAQAIEADDVAAPNPPRTRTTPPGSIRRRVSRCGARGTSFVIGARRTSPSVAGSSAGWASFAAARPRAAAARTRWPDRTAPAPVQVRRATKPQRTSTTAIGRRVRCRTR